MKIDMFQVDAFAEHPFKGNPAAVCRLESWLDDSVLQDIAAENNLSETAFFCGKSSSYKLRWFTPVTEIDLCGHATLAAAFVIYNYYEKDAEILEFETMSGVLKVEKNADLLKMVFPSRPGVSADIDKKLIKALGTAPVEVYKSRDYLLVYDSEETIKNMTPDMELLKKTDSFGIIVTAASRDYDFVSRYFAPGEGIPEDPVTGSSHCTLIPYWAERLGKEELKAKQVSKRSGVLYCRNAGDKVEISGNAVMYLKGEIYIQD